MRKNTGIFNRLLTLSIFVLLFGCKKDVTQKQAETLSAKKGSSLSSMLTPPDVYVAGSEGGVAKYWKNGVGVTLTGGDQASGIFIDGSDVHVCGWGTDPVTFNFVAKYWLNGVLTDLSDGSDNEVPFGITVSGGDVYISGRVGIWVPTSVIWVNGVQSTLGSGQAMGIFAASNGDIYVANQDFGAPSYWKNGTPVSITSAPANTVLYAVAANSSGDVFAVGYDARGSSEDALLFINGVNQTGMMRSGQTRAMNVAVDNNGDPVIAGISGTIIPNLNQKIACWDNPVSLNICGSTEFVGSMMGIAVDPITNEVYVCGSEFNSPGTGPARARYWIVSSGTVGSPVTLGSGASNATAFAIAVDY
jgi:hypothetical protein